MKPDAAFIALMKRVNAAFVVVTMLSLMPATTLGEPPPRFDLYDGKGGATCEYFNRDAHLKWKHRQGDWTDASGANRGTVPFSTTTVTFDSPSVKLDVTGLARASSAQSREKQLTLLLRLLDDASTSRVYVASREAHDTQVRPRLLITDSDGGHHTVLPIADTMLQCSTARSLGTSERLTIATNSYTLLQFDLGQHTTLRIEHAEIELSVIEVINAPASVGVFRLELPQFRAGNKRLDGISAQYEDDAQIRGDQDVIMATGFDEADWRAMWGNQSIRGTYDVVDSSPGDQFVPLYGRALRVTIPKGENLGLDLSFSFKEQTGSEPEEVYFRYYLRLSSNWMPVVDGGKLPGLSGTYGMSGWGGRKADGITGWSMRGQFYRQSDAANPVNPLTTVGTYAYHAAMQDIWGDAWPWTDHGVGLLERNRWYCIEQYVRLNAPGKSDGVLRAWVDGILAFERTDIRYRDTPSLKIEKVWMNVYHGGKATPLSNLVVFLDNVVIARRYIGAITTAH